MLFAATLLVVLAPLVMVIALALMVAQGTPIFFRQPRAGYRGHAFQIVKFRTMTDKRSEDGSLAPDSARMTRVGSMLRHTSLDELPTLWNVLVGDMSLVGPRPLLMEYLPLYTERQARRHNVRPGVTGWAQVNGRNALSWEEKFELDNWYIDHQSFKLDLRILAMTLHRVLRSDGINQPGSVTAERFKGSEVD